MTITLGSSTLVAGQGRYSDGSPTGPENFTLSDAPGVEERRLVGADRVRPEHVGADSATVSFRAVRIFATPAAALTYATSTIFSEATEGALKFDSATILANAAVVQRSLALTGCAVAISYTIRG